MFSPERHRIPQAWRVPQKSSGRLAKGGSRKAGKCLCPRTPLLLRTLPPANQSPNPLAVLAPVPAFVLVLALATSVGHDPCEQDFRKTSVDLAQGPHKVVHKVRTRSRSCSESRCLGAGGGPDLVRVRCSPAAGYSLLGAHGSGAWDRRSPSEDQQTAQEVCRKLGILVPGAPPESKQIVREVCRKGDLWWPAPRISKSRERCEEKCDCWCPVPPPRIGKSCERCDEKLDFWWPAPLQQ